MKSQLLNVIVFLAILFSFSACSKDKLTEVNGIITGIVKDQSGTPISGVIISKMNSNDTIMSHSDGSYVISGVPKGTSFLVIKKPGFAREKVEVTIAFQDFISEQKTEIQNTKNITVYPLLGKIQGIVKGLNKETVASSTILITFKNEIDTVYRTISADDGSFSIDSLPIGAEMFLKSTIDGKSSTELKKKLTDESINNPEGITLKMDNNELKLLSYTGQDYATLIDTTAANAKITLIFSDNINESITKKFGGKIELLYLSDTLIASTITFLDNKVLITPTANLKYGTIYNIKYLVFSSETNSTDNYLSYLQFKIKTKSKPKTPITDTPEISFNNVPNTFVFLKQSTGFTIKYDIYESDGKNSFKRVETEQTVEKNNNFIVLKNYRLKKNYNYYVVPVSIDIDEIRTYGQQSNTITYKL